VLGGYGPAGVRDLDPTQLRGSSLSTFMDRSTDKARRIVVPTATGRARPNPPTAFVVSEPALVQANYARILKNIEAEAIRPAVSTVQAEQAALRNRLLRTGNLFFRRNVDKGPTIVRLSPQVCSSPPRDGPASLLSNAAHLSTPCRRLHRSTACTCTPCQPSCGR